MGDMSGVGVSLALACVALPLLVGAGLPLARAQAQGYVSSAGASDCDSEADPAPQPITAPRDVREIDNSPQSAHHLPPAGPLGLEPYKAGIESGPLDVICESILGEASEAEWRPLNLTTFLSEGWDRPYARSPEGTNGAPKQNWFGSSDGIFSRLDSINFFYTNGMTTNTGLMLSPFPWSPVKPETNGNEYWASYNVYLPLNQRLELLIVVPFVASNTTSPRGHFVGNFGDLTISERFRLVEQRNFSLQASLTERTPTGRTVNGNDINFVTPAIEFWWNLAPRWVLRGGTGINIDTGRTSATDTYFTSVAIGRYFTTRNARYFKEMVAHVSIATMSDVLGRKGHITDVYIAPGLRFGLDRNERWFVLGAIQVPVSGPRPYAFQPNLALSRNF
jgi:hypothetical protein